MDKNMTLIEAIEARHSVRAYKDIPISEETYHLLKKKIDEINAGGDLHIQLILNEAKAFQGPLAKYGKFKGVNNYLVIAGRKAEDLNERAGYYGEQLVLFAQQLGLNTCWVGLSYSKIPDTYVLEENEKIVCYISLGYGETQGVPRRSKKPEDVSNVSGITPKWFNDGVKAALLAPTAVNQQKFFFEYKGGKVTARKVFSLIGYTEIDLGIAELHFEIASGRSITNFKNLILDVK